MRVLSFDLSTNIIGVTAAELDNNDDITKIMSCPIIPPKFDARKLGYLASKKKLPLKSGEELTTYAKPGETSITKAEKKKRDREVRGQKDIQVLEYIGAEINDFIKNVNPNLILVEKNAIFNGILTSILLAKVMGSLLGVAGACGIPVKEYPVDVARSGINIGAVKSEFIKTKTPEELQRIPDITKRALGYYLTKKYGIIFKTDDESDSCVVFDHWYEERRGKKNV